MPLSEKAVVLGSPLSQPRFVPVGSIGDSMAGDGIQELLGESTAEGRVLFALESNHRLEGLQRLHGSLKADRTGVQTVVAGGLGAERAAQMVRQEVRPDLLAHQFPRLAPQHVHLQRSL